MDGEIRVKRRRDFTGNPLVGSGWCSHHENVSMNQFWFISEAWRSPAVRTRLPNP